MALDMIDGFPSLLPLIFAIGLLFFFFFFFFLALD